MTPNGNNAPPPPPPAIGNAPPPAAPPTKQPPAAQAGPPTGHQPASPRQLQPAQQSGSVAGGSSSSPFLTRGNLVLLGLYAAGIAGLYLLSLRGGPKSALADQTMVHAKVEAALNSLGTGPADGSTAADGATARAIVAEFYTAARQRQVPADGLKTNPFVLEEVKPPAPKPDEPKPDPEPAEPEGLAEAMEALKTLKLQSVLVGRQTAAMISNNLVTTGQDVRGWTVTRITPGEVELSWQDRTAVLEMPK